MDFERLLTEITRIELVVESFFVPDGEPPRDYEGPHLIIVVFAGRITALSPRGRTVRPYSQSLARSLLEAASLARTEAPKEGVDTALGRTLTTLRLRVDHARGPSHSFTCQAVINHCHPVLLPSGWSQVLQLVDGALSDVAQNATGAWDLALRNTAPLDLGPTWHNGAALPLPHRISVFELRGPIYLRTGQPPERSFLYQLSAGRLWAVDEGRLIQANGGRWDLPCGGGTIFLEGQWLPIPYVVVVKQDLRGIYVQQG